MVHCNMVPNVSQCIPTMCIPTLCISTLCIPMHPNVVRPNAFQHGIGGGGWGRVHREFARIRLSHSAICSFTASVFCSIISLIIQTILCSTNPNRSQIWLDKRILSFIYSLTQLQIYSLLVKLRLKLHTCNNRRCFPGKSAQTLTLGFALSFCPAPCNANANVHAGSNKHISRDDISCFLVIKCITRKQSPAL